MQGYQETVAAVGFWDASDRTTFDLCGEDRKRLLHSFCTADILQLPSDGGTEAFILNPKGKTLALIRVSQLPDRLAIDADPDLGPTLIAHLDKYVIVEKVTFEDRQQTRALIMVAGPEASSLIDTYFDLSDDDSIRQLAELGTRVEEINGHSIRIQCRRDYATECWGIDMPASFRQEFLPWIVDRGAAACDRETIETLRVEQGTPMYGVDFSADTLPQELQRDAKAISFKKGCYLGQETVARIDALGHVNRLFVGVKLNTEQPVAAGSSLFDEAGKPIGSITSVVNSPRLDAWIGLATVKRGHHRPAKACFLEDQQSVDVVALPFIE